MPVKVSGIHHVAVPVVHLEDAKHFYGRVLGLSSAPRPRDIPGASYSIGLQELHLGETDSAVRSRAHFAIAIDPVNYDQYLAEIRERGGELLRGPNQTRAGFYQALHRRPIGKPHRAE